MPHSLVLHHYWRSSCSWRVRWVLALKGVPYASHAVNLLKNEQQSPEYLAINPQGLVPTLEVDGRYLSESQAIIEWLEESYPTPSILPRDPWDRAVAREIAAIVATGIQPLQNLRTQREHASDQQAKERWARFFIATGFEALEGKLKGSQGPYCCGERVTIADIYLVPQVYNALRYAIEMERFPRLKAIYELCLATPACDAAAPHRQEGAGTS